MPCAPLAPRLSTACHSLFAKTASSLPALGLAAFLVLGLGSASASPDGSSHNSSNSPQSPRTLYIAAKAAESEDESKRLHEAGLRAARALLEAEADSPEGLLYLSANMGAGALLEGKMAALRVIPEMEKLLLKLHEVAPEYESAAAARTLARLYHVAPSLMSIGSAKKARIWIERALVIAPRHAGNQAFAADFYRDEGEPARARSHALACLRALRENDYAPHAEEWMALAKSVEKETRRPH